MFVGSRGSAAMGFLDKRIADLEAQTRRVWQGSDLTRSVFEQVKHLVGLANVIRRRSIAPASCSG